MKLLATIDTLHLEEHLLERLARRPRGGLLDPVLVLVPSSRLGTHLKRRIAARCGTALGVHVLTHRGFAIRALELALEPPPRVLPEAALLELVEDAVRQLRAAREAAAAHLERFPGARAGLLSTFKDLRDAGVEPSALARLRDAGIPAAVRRGYTSYCEALARLEASGHTDDAGLVRAALPHAGSFLERKGIRAVYQHGAYELTGTHVELLEACEPAATVLVLLPSELDGPAFAYGARFGRRLAAGGKALEPLAGPAAQAARGDFVVRLRALFTGAEEGSPLTSDAEPRFELQTAQGPEDELRAAALRALAIHHQDQVPLEEIAIVARSLGPYTPFLEGALDGLDIPFTSSAMVPAGRDPVCGAFLALLRVLEGGFARQATIDLLRRGRLRHGQERTSVGLWDRLSREARLTGGLAEWRRLPELARRAEERRSRRQEGSTDPGAPAAEAEAGNWPALLAILDELEEEARRWRQARTLREHAVALRDLATRRLRIEPGEDAALSRALAALEAIATAQSLLAGDDDVAATGPAEVLALLRSQLAEAGERLHGADEGGVRVLDLMQARGLTHRVVIWIGFHHGLFPRLPAPDTWLDDEARERIARATQKPLTRKLEASDEERLLLALTLASARDRIVISWQRADADGRQVARSSALREIARLVTGAPDSARLLEAAPGEVGPPSYVPAHPGQQVAWLGGEPRFGLVPSRSAIAAGAARAGDPPAMAAALVAALGEKEGTPASEAAVRCVAGIEQFSGGCSAYDGRLDRAPVLHGALSPTAIERLACCPQRFFLRHLLGVREIEAAAVAHELDARALGGAAHRALELVLGSLWPEGRIAWTADTPATALRELETAWPLALREAAGAAGDRLPALLEALGEPWLARLRRFLAADLAALEAEGASRLALERKIAAALPLPGGAEASLQGYIDRVVWTGAGAVIDDYKSGSKIKDKVKAEGLRTGQDLQLFLYREMAAQALEPRPGQVEARYLAIGPAGEDEKKGPRGAIALETTGDERQAGLETVATALGLWRQGLFPLHRDPDANGGYCQYCEFRRTCRRGHPPTRERLQGDPKLAAHLSRWQKQPRADGKKRATKAKEAS